MKFKAILEHDNGTVAITTSATSKEAAIDQICEAEGCPRCAIVSITQS